LGGLMEGDGGKKKMLRGKEDWIIQHIYFEDSIMNYITVCKGRGGREGKW
jgi:hypothetical protein